MSALSDFNSRPSARGDAEDIRRIFLQTISIHAPPRGATRPAWRTCRNSNDFNSRPSARGDYMVKKGEHAALFQFTPLREGRR